jgi:hypothetical protein
MSSEARALDIIAQLKELEPITDEHKEAAMAGWKIEGQYMETCNCSYVCPCITSNLADTPTEGDCKAALAMRIDKGHKDGVSLDGLKFLVLLYAPQAMEKGEFTVGLIIDEAASDEQVEAIGAIASGEAGGPMAAMGPLVGTMAGVERRPISFEADGMTYRVNAGELIEQSCEGVASAVAEDEPMHIDNAMHPVNTRVALAKATRSHFHAFGIDWDDDSGMRNGHFAPFSWSG